MHYFLIIEWVLQTKYSVHNITNTTAPSCKGARHSISAHTSVDNEICKKIGRTNQLLVQCLLTDQTSHFDFFLSNVS